jgi:DNA polymerase/3'-5' exonuclease PolX
MKLDIARRLASEITRRIRPHCDRFEIAGSIRRCKPDVKDIEIVCVPKSFTSSSALFGGKDITKRSDGFVREVNKFKKIKGDAREGRYMQREFEIEKEDFPAIEERNIIIDIFTATPSSWGSQFLIRTGDRDFSKLFMGTILPRHGYRADSGFVWKGNDVVNLPEERDVFALVGIPFIEPHLRTAESLQKYL